MHNTKKKILLLLLSFALAFFIKQSFYFLFFFVLQEKCRTKQKLNQDKTAEKTTEMLDVGGKGNEKWKSYIVEIPLISFLKVEKNKKKSQGKNGTFTRLNKYKCGTVCKAEALIQKSNNINLSYFSLWKIIIIHFISSSIVSRWHRHFSVQKEMLQHIEEQKPISPI